MTIRERANDYYPQEECLSPRTYNAGARQGYILGYTEAIDDAIKRLNESLDIDASFLRELLSE